MIPIRDLHPPSRTPYVTYGLIAVNVFVFFFGLSLDVEVRRALVSYFGFIPALFSTGAVLVPVTEGGASDHLFTPFTSMFLHGDFAHIVGNMWFLHVFGDNVEDALGKARFTAFYFAAGFFAALAQLVVDPASTLPMIGASGAVAGVLGAYLVLYPRARVLVLVPIFVIVSFFEWPAYLVVGEWFVIQVLAGLIALSRETPSGGVAWFAHIGGFLVGLVSARALSLPDDADARAPSDRRAI